MLFTSEFDGGLPIGTTLQAVGSGLPWPMWRPLDGGLLSRMVDENQQIKNLFPVGALTGTIRTLAAIPVAPAITIATATHFITAGASGTSGLQQSTDGASWATVAVPATALAGIVATPTRLVAISSTAGAPIVSANLNPTSAWSSTTGGPVSVSGGTSQCRMAYTPAGPGRVVAVHPTTGPSTLDEGATAWVSRTGSCRTGIAWTGLRLVGIATNSNVACHSADGTTYTDILLPEALTSGNGNIASNGLGIVVITGVASGLLFSDDHGATFRALQIPGIPASDLWRVQFSDGYFFIPTAFGLAISPNGRNWFLDPTMMQTMTVSTGVAKKGNLILEIPGVTTTAYTLVESATQFYLPNTQLRTGVNGSGNPIAQNPTYVKAL